LASCQGLLGLVSFRLHRPTCRLRPSPYCHKVRSTRHANYPFSPQSRGNVVFVLHELANTLVAQYISYAPSNTANIPTFSTVSVLPPAIPGDVTPGRFHAAELILSLDGQYLYASNRDTSATPDPRGDAIAIIRVAGNGSLTIVKHVFTGLQLLRGFSLSPDGKYLIGGGQAAGGVAAWAIVSGGADLKEVARNSAGPAATGFTWL